VLPGVSPSGAVRLGVAGEEQGPRIVPVGEVPGDATVVRMTGTILPGLRDAHVHSGLVDLVAVRRGGIAAVTDLGSAPADLLKLHGPSKPSSLRGNSDLPVLDVVGAFLTAPGGYPSDRAWAAPGSWREVRSPADAAEAVHEQVALAEEVALRQWAAAGVREVAPRSSPGTGGSRLVKVALNADAGPVLQPAELAALVAAAHGVGAEVVAHVQGAGMAHAALTAGVDGLAHTPWTEDLDPAMLRDLAERTWWISTLAIHGGAGDATSPPGPEREPGRDRELRLERESGRHREPGLEREPKRGWELGAGARSDWGPGSRSGEGNRAGSGDGRTRDGGGRSGGAWSGGGRSGEGRSERREGEVALANLRGFLELGGVVRYGTDLGNGPLRLGVNPIEIRALQAAGLSPDAILAAMTTVGLDRTAGPGPRHGPEGHRSGLPVPLCWVPAGLDRDPEVFAQSLAGAVVVGPELRELAKDGAGG
jgi:hypothetical protein